MDLPGELEREIAQMIAQNAQKVIAKKDRINDQSREIRALKSELNAARKEIQQLKNELKKAKSTSLPVNEKTNAGTITMTRGSSRSNVKPQKVAKKQVTKSRAEHSVSEVPTKSSTEETKSLPQRKARPGPDSMKEPSLKAKMRA